MLDVSLFWDFQPILFYILNSPVVQLLDLSEIANTGRDTHYNLEYLFDYKGLFIPL
ncbi:hypothetical protein ETSB_0938 [cyanobacterium endosymbiont of Epithemia turgida isolate EtSB Lake Yunoko]|nr:hypothetical protein ETSB_0938 [cyanobacterium endosymbiont of Epithemia turgida isolate EtSB Lake Yunoko]